MTVRTLRARTALTPDALLQRLGDHTEFPAHSPDILSVTPHGEGHSSWRLAFRGAAVNWVQRDEAGPDGLTFEQTEGDFITLRGAWRIRPATGGATADGSAAGGSASQGSGAPGGSEVSYEVDFRTSVAHLAGAVDPVIARVLLRSAYAVLTGLAGGAELVSGGEYLHDLAPAAG
jgi:hypothetical protein